MVRAFLTVAGLGLCLITTVIIGKAYAATLSSLNHPVFSVISTVVFTLLPTGGLK